MIDEDDILRFDSKDRLSFLDSLPRQLEDALQSGRTTKVNKPISNVVICGIGQSSLPGKLLKSCVEINVPIEICCGQTIPKYVGPDSLVFLISYSGNTEEILLLFDQAKRKSAKIVVISSAGKLREKAVIEGIPHVSFPQGMPKGAATSYITVLMLNVLRNSGLVLDKSQEIIETIAALKKDFKRDAITIAEKIANKTLLIYSSEEFGAIAEYWKTRMNEDAKTNAFFNYSGELTSSEISSFSNLKGSFFVIILRDKDDSMKIQQKMEAAKSMIQSRGVPVLMINISGKNKLAKIFISCQLASYVSYYLAIMHITDPSS